MGRRRSGRDYPTDDHFDDDSLDGMTDDATGDVGDESGFFTPGLGEPFNVDLVPLDDDDASLPALYDEEAPLPVLIPGSGVSMGNPYIRRRERPLTMRLAIVALTACLLVTGLFTVAPLGAKADGGITSFTALSGAVVYQAAPSYHWYVAQWGDSVESIAARFHVQIGGIYEMNNMASGQEVTIGKAYKIPDDAYYGQNYRPPTLFVTGSGTTTYGNSPWTSIAGTPPKEVPCAPNGNGNPMGYKLVPPNPGAIWIRGFTWYHNGVDLAAPEGNPIHAAQAGEVIWAGWDVGGLGWSVKINHCNGISTVYGHMEKLLVKVHDVVIPGAVIGLEGSTGWSTGPHCHFMVEWNNNPVNPMAYYGWSVAAITR